MLNAVTDKRMNTSKVIHRLYSFYDFANQLKYLTTHLKLRL